jgi:predicted adenylyl cyclase CyaB
MYEVEVKAKLKDRDAIFKKLTDLGCTFSEELHQIDDIFTPLATVFPPPKGEPVLRIRDENGKFILTLKINQSSRQDCIEHEVEVKDKVEMDKIIKLLGFRDDVTVDKKRIKTKYKDMEVVLDIVKDLGEFIEAEKMTDEADPEARKKIQEELYEFLETLGVGKEDRVIDGKYDIMLIEKLQGK